MKEKNKGITLIALVITIVILLILAGIAINQLTGDNGLFTRTKQARIKTRESQAEEILNLEINRVQVDKLGKVKLNDLLDDFSVNDYEKIDVIEVITDKVATISCEIPEGEIQEITVKVKNYNEFSFTIGQDCKIIKICGIPYNEWDGETLENTEKITITADPASQIETYVDKQVVQIKVTSEDEYQERSGQYAWNRSKTTKPTDEEWETLSLDAGENQKEKIAKVTSSVNEQGSYYLWIKIITGGQTKIKSFGPYNIAEVPTENNLICVLNEKTDNDTKGIVEVGSNKAFEGWTCSYSKNGGTYSKITGGTTTTIDVVKNDEIVVKYSKEGNTDVSKTLKIIELKNRYILRYEANEGLGAPESETQYDNNKFTISNTVPTRAGYTFTEWNTKADGTGTSYGSGTNITISGTITLYAQWKQSIFEMPELTSNTVNVNGYGTFYITASSIYNTTTQPYRAFDHVTGDSSSLFNVWHSTKTMPSWIQLQLPFKCEIKKFAITNRWSNIDHVKEFYLQGSNDGTNWSKLTNNLNNSTTIGATTEFVVNYPGFYSYYRWYVTSGTTGYAIIDEIWIREIIKN